MRVSVERKSVKTLAKEMASLPPLLLRNMKFSFLEDGEVTPTQLSVILAICDYSSPIRMNELAKMMSSSMPTMTGIITRLVEKEIVERGGDPSDRRVVTVRLTKKGRKMANELLKMIEKLWSSIFAKLNESERKDFISIIRKIKSYLSGGNRI